MAAATTPELGQQHPPLTLRIQIQPRRISSNRALPGSPPVSVRRCSGPRAQWPAHGSFAMMEPMTTTPTPLVTREALLAFTQRLVECYAPEKVILFGSLARGVARWDSDADVLVVMPFEGRHLAKIREIRRLCQVRFPLDLLVRRPEEIEVRYRGGDPVVREALDHGELLHG
ncbi:MAG: hypothetical protein DCF23_11070 [Cyanobium sp.]|nr:MAG: hypothetical protein DCF23_11070 [Cyanobium sp.]